MSIGSARLRLGPIRLPYVLGMIFRVPDSRSTTNGAFQRYGLMIAALLSTMKATRVHDGTTPKIGFSFHWRGPNMAASNSRGVTKPSTLP